MSPNLISKLSIAPMIDWTYTHFRVFMRILAPNSLLYTEMITSGAIQHNPARSLYFNPLETPIALQLGGSLRNELVAAAKDAERQGYQEINLNLGCPSDRVQAGQFGACLMQKPSKVAECILAMKEAVDIPITAKTRIGIDKEDSYEFFSSFAHTLINAGCDKLIVHARKAWLNGLSPKQNRTIPPIQYDYVYKIKQELPNIPVVINGNIQTIDAIQTHLQQVDGVMLGRLACQNPYAIACIHHALFPDIPLLSRNEIIQKYLIYIESLSDKRIPISLLLKPLFNMAHGLVGARRWKEQLLEVQRLKSFDELTINVDSFNDVD